MITERNKLRWEEILLAQAQQSRPKMYQENWKENKDETFKHIFYN